MEDIIQLCKVADTETGAGIMGAITGRAIYEGALDLGEAQAYCDMFVKKAPVSLPDDKCCGRGWGASHKRIGVFQLHQLSQLEHVEPSYFQALREYPTCYFELAVGLAI